MRKLKIYLVDEDIYWADYSLNEAYENYKRFSLEESGFYDPPSLGYPVELESSLTNKKILGTNNKKITIKEALEKFNKVGLLYCDFF